MVFSYFEAFFRPKGRNGREMKGMEGQDRGKNRILRRVYRDNEGIKGGLGKVRR